MKVLATKMRVTLIQIINEMQCPYQLCEVGLRDLPSFSCHLEHLCHYGFSAPLLLFSSDGPQNKTDAAASVMPHVIGLLSVQNVTQEGRRRRMPLRSRSHSGIAGLTALCPSRIGTCRC